MIHISSNFPSCAIWTAFNSWLSFVTLFLRWFLMSISCHLTGLALLPLIFPGFHFNYICTMLFQPHFNSSRFITSTSGSKTTPKSGDLCYYFYGLKPNPVSGGERRASLQLDHPALCPRGCWQLIQGSRRSAVDTRRQRKVPAFDMHLYA